MLKIIVSLIMKKISKKLKYSYGYKDNKVIDKDNILIIDCNLLNDDGIVKYYHYHIEEVLITIPKEAGK